MLNIAFDMETSDPDDIFTLCLLSHHPRVNLVAVTVTPGSKHQIGLVQYVLALLGKNIPVGARNIDHPKECVSQFHYSWLGKIAPATSSPRGADVLLTALERYCDDLTIVCGAPLGNIRALLQKMSICLFDKTILIPRLVVQGGFAGDNIVPAEHRLSKFNGRITCPTFNLNGDVQAALDILSSDKIIQRIFVSKNVCHGVKYDQTMHQWLQPYQEVNPGIQLMYEGMDHYLRHHKDGKAFHDPLAACVAIDQTVCRFAEVELYREKGEWGSRVSSNPNALISIQADLEKFKAVMIG